MKDYCEIVKSVLDDGEHKSNRTGVDTISQFGVYYKIPMSAGFPLLTTKKISWKNVLIENLWFLSGKPDIGFLRKHSCKFWDPWADEAGLVPSAYGNLWRWHPTTVDLPADSHGLPFQFFDQLSWVVNELRRNPNSRRLVVSAWAPGNACSSSLPPCHYTFVLNVQRGRLNLHMTQRSCDVALGLPYNIAGYAFLLHLFARFAGLELEPGEFGHSIIDCHIYENHIAGLYKQIARKPISLPTLVIDSNVKTLKNVEELIREATTHQLLSTFRIDGYDPHPAIKFEVAV